MPDGLSGDPNCGLFAPFWNSWVDLPCQISSAQPVGCACEHPEQMYLQLRGLCPHSNIDRFYVPRNKMKSGAVMLIGLATTIIEYDNDNMLWRLTELSKNTSATTNASLPSYALGAHEWIIDNDNVKCGTKGELFRGVLKLTGCREGDFTCSDGQCIRFLNVIKKI